MLVAMCQQQLLKMLICNMCLPKGRDPRIYFTNEMLLSKVTK